MHYSYDSLIDIPCIQQAIMPDLSYLHSPQLNQWIHSHKKYIVIGVGGSSLAGQALYNLSIHKTKKDIIFLDSIDPSTLYKTISQINLEETGILAISKSGETLETLSQLLILIEHYDRKAIGQHFLAITQVSNTSTMRKIAADFSIFVIDHPNDIGGRYSVFTPVGMVPATILGLNISRLFEGAQHSLNNLNTIISESEFLRKSSNHVFFHYSDKLEKFCAWISQLYAESSGKNGNGITPIVAKGTVDQHSQLQLYLDGLKDKAFTFFIENHIDHITCSNLFQQYTRVSLLHNKPINALFAAEAKATISALSELPTRTFNLENIDEYTIGSLFMRFIIEIIAHCRNRNIDPFNQPAVETMKQNIVNNLNKS